MGGYWALRAAGREPRIDSVVAWPPVYDWLYRLPALLRGPIARDGAAPALHALERPCPRPAVPDPALVVDQALYMVDGDDPVDAADWFLGMNAEHLGSERVTQDVLCVRRARRLPAAGADPGAGSCAHGRPSCHDAHVHQPSRPTSTARWETSSLPAGSHHMVAGTGRERGTETGRRAGQGAGPRTRTDGHPGVGVAVSSSALLVLVLRFCGSLLGLFLGVLLGAQSLRLVLFLGFFLVDDLCEELLHLLGHTGG